MQDPEWKAAAGAIVEEVIKGKNFSKRHPVDFVRLISSCSDCDVSPGTIATTLSFLKEKNSSAKKFILKRFRRFKQVGPPRVI
jgi:hypothetical protein